MIVTGPRAKRNAYKISCPTCQAPAGHYCVTSDGSVSKYAHAKRDRTFTPELPDLRRWWKLMGRLGFEGEHPKPRPAWLRVP